MDKIIVKNAKFEVNLGVTNKEQGTPQPIEVDITVCREDGFSAKTTDHINDTLNYADLHRHVATAVRSKKFNTLEHLTETIFNQIAFGIGHYTNIIIQVRKPLAMRHKNVEYAAVEIERSPEY